MAFIRKSKVFNFWLRRHLCAANNPYPVNLGLQEIVKGPVLSRHYKTLVDSRFWEYVQSLWYLQCRSPL